MLTMKVIKRTSGTEEEEDEVDVELAEEVEAEDVLVVFMHRKKLGSKVKAEIKVISLASTVINSATMQTSAQISCLNYKKPLRRKKKTLKRRMN